MTFSYFTHLFFFVCSDDIGDIGRKSKPATKMYNMKQICVLLFIYVTVVLGNYAVSVEVSMGIFAGSFLEESTPYIKFKCVH